MTAPLDRLTRRPRERAKLATLTPKLATLDTRRAKPPPKTADPYYLTPEHRAWREAVIARAGNRCEDCGRTGVRLFADHVVEIQDGGSRTDPANGRARCGSCHQTKTIAERAKRQARR